MKILYDLFGTQAHDHILYNGGAEYSKAIFLELIKNLETEQELVVFYDKDLALEENVLRAVQNSAIQVVYIKNGQELQDHLFAQNYDLFFSALPILYYNIKIPKSCLYVGVMHDVRVLELLYDEDYKYYTNKFNPKKYKSFIFAHSLSWPYLSKFMARLKFKKELNLYEKIAQSIDIIITVSEHSKFSLLYYLKNLKSEGIKVYYTPKKIISVRDDNMGNKYGEYVLLISANRYEKNPIGAIRALERLYSKGLLEAKCVTVGNLPQKIRNIIKYPEKFIHLDYVSTEELESLYKNAQLFIYPTFSEGFGMPPLEALKYGTKVVASAVTAVPEICGDSVFYFNPYSIDEIAVRIYQAMNSEKLSDDYFIKTSKRQEVDLQRLVSDIKNGFGG